MLVYLFVFKYLLFKVVIIIGIDVNIFILINIDELLLIFLVVIRLVS